MSQEIRSKLLEIAEEFEERSELASRSSKVMEEDYASTLIAVELGGASEAWLIAARELRQHAERQACPECGFSEKRVLWRIKGGWDCRNPWHDREES